MYNNTPSNPVKTYVLDTNVLLSDPKSIYAFQEHNVVIPLIVIEELDNHKSRQDEIGKNAREISRELDNFRLTGKLFHGITLPSGGTLSVSTLKKSSSDHTNMPLELNDKKTDNLLIAFMLSESPDTILVSRDINVRLKCDAVNVKCEDYKRLKVVSSDQTGLYTGVTVIEESECIIQSIYDGRFNIEETDILAGDCKYYPNQIVILKSSTPNSNSKSAITRYVNNTLQKIPSHDKIYGLSPKNKEQNFSLDLLLDPSISLVTLTGPAGTGKTLLALATALEQLESFGSKGIYKKVIVTRPVQPVGKDIGFLPGTLEEKMEPWIAPIRDNLNFLMNKGKKKTTKTFSEPYVSLMQQKGLIEIEAISHIRGRSIPDSFIVIDEAQNLSIHELKTIITRVGEGTKIVLTGDTEQIDNIHVDTYTNGLTYAVEKFKEHSIAGHVSLIKGERSNLATLASKIL